MLSLPLSMIRRLRLACLLLLTLAAMVPALGAHACVDAGCATVALASGATVDEAKQPCADCGQACANGCCHAPHPATAPDVSMIQTVSTFTVPLSWSHSIAPPLADAAGPRRPPRI
ncbi:hypothetical protein [Brevundimonas sp. Leaf363]|uniref:hypothetical protein n=1 Tax=Brevundimonas sp. Leaf363 TaxID=1736353 RepID=UPI0012E26B6C|nr:hypothetical protein [Brevundimonas sp. Leaf363]